MPNTIQGKLSRAILRSDRESRKSSDNFFDLRAACANSGAYYDSLKLPDGVNLSEAEKSIAAWVCAYADMKKIGFKEAMKDVVGHIKETPYLLELYREEGVSFGEGARARGVVEFQVAVPRAQMLCRMAEMFQAASGYSFVESVSKVDEFL